MKAGSGLDFPGSLNCPSLTIYTPAIEYGSVNYCQWEPGNGRYRTYRWPRQFLSAFPMFFHEGASQVSPNRTFHYGDHVRVHLTRIVHRHAGQRFKRENNCSCEGTTTGLRVTVTSGHSKSSGFECPLYLFGRRLKRTAHSQTLNTFHPRRRKRQQPFCLVTYCFLPSDARTTDYSSNARTARASMPEAAIDEQSNLQRWPDKIGRAAYPPMTAKSAKSVLRRTDAISTSVVPLPRERTEAMIRERTARVT